MSEWFCRFFSLRLSKFTQTSCTFQARGAPTCDVPGEKPVQLAWRTWRETHVPAQLAGLACTQKEPGYRAIASGLWCV